MENQHENTPRIYAASLADYNDGRLHGDWIEAAQEPDMIFDDINTMLQASSMPLAEEWAIHDYEHFGVFEPHEYESVRTISRIAIGLTLHGPAYAHWAQVVGTQNADELGSFEDRYLGSWESLAAYAEDYIESTGVDLAEGIPGFLRPYVRIDFEQLGNDLAADLNVSGDRGDLHVFQA